VTPAWQAKARGGGGGLQTTVTKNESQGQLQPSLGKEYSMVMAPKFLFGKTGRNHLLE